MTVEISLPVWYDFSSRGCPICGAALVLDTYERPRGPFAHMSCVGSGPESIHRWLVYRRRGKFGAWRWSRMRVLKRKTGTLW